MADEVKKRREHREANEKLPKKKLDKNFVKKNKWFIIVGLVLGLALVLYMRKQSQNQQNQGTSQTGDIPGGQQTGLGGTLPGAGGSYGGGGSGAPPPAPGGGGGGTTGGGGGGGGGRHRRPPRPHEPPPPRRRPPPPRRRHPKPPPGPHHRHHPGPQPQTFNPISFHPPRKRTGWTVGWQ